ncbi:phosphate acyltransferase PlsX [Alcanivorax sp. S6407]|uniref:phosphate acyltransferase PlsX n=1 Tax=Alcanivorax sp. S6407 TaxID=2926424 RepID=UPI001FF3A31D|nr:phosphate acyltransferase PlsX [Alcanivorax sp. S6407]MCK0155420.1 phosphate acyltransferase PlsX [Alcanivorax sp. S6407]
MSVVTLAVDAMGGDHGLSVTVPAVAKMLSRHDHLNIILVGQPEPLAEAMSKHGLEGHARITVEPASEVVAMDDSVAVAMRQKKDSSMRVAVNQVKDGKAQAAVSAGNTGALMAVSRFVLKTLPGVDRPAICTAIPTSTGHCHMLDLGANVDSEPAHLVQFALMGQALVRAVDGERQPRVALLNIGEEDIKGNEQIKEAAALLRDTPDMNYVGFVEGNGIFAGEADVVVCDGFVGNVSLKTMEGVAKMIGNMIREEIGSSWLRKLSGLLALPVLAGLKKRMDPDRYNGASLVGLKGVVVKSHGGTSVEGFISALEVAELEARRNVPALIRDALAPEAAQDTAQA